jgi:hypothetical protein
MAARFVVNALNTIAWVVSELGMRMESSRTSGAAPSSGVLSLAAPQAVNRSIPRMPTPRRLRFQDSARIIIIISCFSPGRRLRVFPACLGSRKARDAPPPGKMSYAGSLSQQGSLCSGRGYKRGSAINLARYVPRAPSATLSHRTRPGD